jgi:DNA-binding NarL/FixJ family response regulator
MSTLVALVDDLFFGSRIRETARSLGVGCELVKDPATLVERAAEADARLVIVDMSLRRGDPAAAVRALKSDERTRAAEVVGYLFDSDDERIRAARAAGCDRVLSRGGLTQRLAEIVRGAAG